jgi:protein tyrosine phosphatase
MSMVTKILLIKDQLLPCLQQASQLMDRYPTTTKILKVVGLVLGASLLATSPFLAPLGTKAVISCAAIGATLILSTLVLFNFSSRTLPPPAPVLPRDAPAPAPNVLPLVLPTATLWSVLKEKTLSAVENIDYLSSIEVHHRFQNIRCPRQTAISIEDQYLHANRIGQGMTQRILAASQAPLKEDYELFWKAIFKNNFTIIDLTTAEDQLTRGVTEYYPNQLNQVINYGVMSVKLIQESDDTHTYQITNTLTHEVKNINRYHYSDWLDFDAVSVASLHELVQKVELLSPDPQNGTLIHCRAGVGRTGTLITALILKEKIKDGSINGANLDTSLLNLIIELRKQRDPRFVQEQVQLDLLRQYADFLFKL